ncbi:hypothetical protein [Allokutzneria multivorans]|uniref:hypothetical protein n=1 Tax=Allokutzneria multivorans TaxID=1142134 RepID=UPI0031F02C07
MTWFQRHQILLSGREPRTSRLTHDDVTLLGAWLLGLSRQAPPGEGHVEPEHVRKRLREVTDEAALRRPRNLDEWKEDPDVKWALLARSTTARGGS